LRISRDHRNKQRSQDKAVKKARIYFNHVSRRPGPTRVEELTSDYLILGRNEKTDYEVTKSAMP